jgi:hypothetical protein
VAPVSKTYVGGVTSSPSSFAKTIGMQPNLAIRYFNWDAKDDQDSADVHHQAGPDHRDRRGPGCRPVGQDPGPVRRRFDVRGIVWFDINQTVGVHHQRWALEGHPGEIAAFRKGLAAWQKAVG